MVDFLFVLTEFFRYLLRFRSYEAKCVQLGCFHTGVDTIPWRTDRRTDMRTDTQTDGYASNNITYKRTQNCWYSNDLHWERYEPLPTPNVICSYKLHWASIRLETGNKDGIIGHHLCKNVISADNISEFNPSSTKVYCCNLLTISRRLKAKQKRKQVLQQ